MSCTNPAQSSLVLRSVTLGQAPASQRLAGHEHVAHAAAFVLVVVALGPPGRRCKGFAGLANQLAGRLVHAHHGSPGIVGLAVDIEHLFHGSDEGGTRLRGNHPADQPVGSIRWKSGLASSLARPLRGPASPVSMPWFSIFLLTSRPTTRIRCPSRGKSVRCGAPSFAIRRGTCQLNTSQKNRVPIGVHAS